MLCLKTGSIDKDILRVRLGQNADDAVPRRLRLARHDADLFADQMIQQRRLTTTIGPNHCQQTAFGHLTMQVMHHRVSRVAERQVVKMQHVYPIAQ